MFLGYRVSTNQAQSSASGEYLGLDVSPLGIAKSIHPSFPHVRAFRFRRVSLTKGRAIQCFLVIAFYVLSQSASQWEACRNE